MTTHCLRVFEHLKEQLSALRFGDVARFTLNTETLDILTLRVDVLQSDSLRFSLTVQDMWGRYVTLDALFVSRRDDLIWFREIIIASQVRGPMIPHVNVYTPRVVVARAS